MKIPQDAMDWALGMAFGAMAVNCKHEQIEYVKTLSWAVVTKCPRCLATIYTPPENKKAPPSNRNDGEA